VEYANDLFDYGRNQVPDNLPKDLGFAGFKVLYPLHTDSHYDEVAVFLGASYFRAVGQGQNYGLSARGLAHRHRPDQAGRISLLSRVLAGKTGVRTPPN
jgi:glucans biosynthesis protein